MGDGADEAPPRCRVTPPKPKDKGGSGGAEPKLPQSPTSRYETDFGRREEEIYIDSNPTTNIDYLKTGQPRPN